MLASLSARLRRAPVGGSAAQASASTSSVYSCISRLQLSAWHSTSCWASLAVPLAAPVSTWVHKRQNAAQASPSTSCVYSCISRLQLSAFACEPPFIGSIIPYQDDSR